MSHLTFSFCPVGYGLTLDFDTSEPNEKIFCAGPAMAPVVSDQGYENQKKRRKKYQFKFQSLRKITSKLKENI